MEALISASVLYVPILRAICILHTVLLATLMAPRSKWSRTRRARATTQPEPLPARAIKYGDLLPPELWREAFSYCLPLTLFAARDTCRLFRRMIDRNDGSLLARAPLLLSDPPPDPRWYMQRSRNEHVRQIIGEVFGITDPWSDIYGSAAYTKMLYLPDVQWARRGTSRLYYKQHRQGISVLRKPPVIVPSRSPLIYISPISAAAVETYSGRKTIAVAACDLVRAREEYEQNVLASATATERRRERKALFTQYKSRCRQKRTLGILECLVEYWKEKNDSKIKQNLKINKARLRAFANERQIPLSQALGNPDVQRALVAHSRVFALISPSILSDAGLFNPTSNRVPSSSHPKQFPYTRLGATTGKAEYRCALCPLPALRWFSAVALQAHQLDKHGVRGQEEQE
ncbi:uncharacterized protein SCHCODRAFT_02500300 [Schizophyllum commune H4-8]|nr:uncharacterized protein SCHCODRAFT_02500300 [Schizophyllum commune H4-8]KAI5894253.1 hypothetical protein SCHCODRAFT_02500300 [Schizophyllum commune H4-8]